MKSILKLSTNKIRFLKIRKKIFWRDVASLEVESVKVSRQAWIMKGNPSREKYVSVVLILTRVWAGLGP